MSVVASVAINVDAANAIKQLRAVQTAANSTAKSFDDIKTRAKQVQSAVEASQGGFAKASTVQGVFAAKVRNTEQAIRAQIAALKQVQSQVSLGGALYKKAGDQIAMYQAKLVAASAAAPVAAGGFKLIETAIESALGPISLAIQALASITFAFQVLQQQDFAVAKVKSLGVNADELVSSLKQVSQELNGSASVVELTGAAYDVASAGFTNAKDAAMVLKAAALGAAGGFTDMNTAGNAVTSVLNAYGMSASQAGLIMDQFVQTQNDGKIVVAEYAQNIGKVAAAAAALNIPLEEVNAAVAQSTASGVQADVAFTGLKSALARLASGEAAKALEGTGLSIDAASLSADGLIGTLRKMVAAGLDTGQIFKALGTEAGPALLPLLNNLEKTEQLLLNQKNAAGTAAQAQKTATDTISGAWKRVTTAFSNIFSEQTAAGTAIKLTLEAVAFNIESVGKVISIVTVPLNIAFQVLQKVVNGAMMLKDAFISAFQQSEGGQKLAAVLQAIGQLSGKVAEFVSGKLGQAFSFVLDIVSKLGNFIGNVLFAAIDKIVQGVIGLAKFIPGLRDKAFALEQTWNDIKSQTGQTTEEVKKQQPVLDQQKEKLAAIKLEAQTQLAVLAQQKQINEQNNQLLDSQRGLLKGLNDIAKDRYSTQLKYALSFQEEVAVINQITKAKKESNRLDEENANIQAQRNIDNAYIAAEEAKLKAEVAAADLKALDANTENYNTKKLELETIIKGADIAERGIGIAYAVAENTRQGAAAARERADAVAKQAQSEGIVAAFAREVADRNKVASQLAQEMTNSLDNQVKLSSAAAETQKTINNAQIQNLDNALKQAETEEDRANIKSQIRQLEIANAAITLQATQTQIAAEVERQRIAMDLAAMKYKELEAVVNLAAAQKVLTQDHIRALEAQRSALVIAQQNYATSQAVANEQYRAADAVYNAAVNAANLKMNLEGSAAAAGAIAGSMERAAATTGTTGGGYLTAENIKNPLLRAEAESRIADIEKRASPTGGVMSILGTLDKRQQVVLEYMALEKRSAKEQEMQSAAEQLRSAGLTKYIPSSYRTEEDRAAMFNRYGAAASSSGTGATNPQVNITTGPVMQMDGTNYVTQRDLVSATGEAARKGANMALEMLQNNPAARRRTGVTQ